MKKQSAQRIESQEQKHFEFLDELRKLGQTNMYGAAPNLIEAFPEDFDDIEPKRGLNQGHFSQKARETLMKWMHRKP